jgi:hypothetical protein
MIRIVLVCIALAGCVSPRSSSPEPTDALLEMRVAYSQPGPDRVQAEYEDSVIYIGRALVSDSDFVSVDPLIRDSGLVLAVEISTQAADRLTRGIIENAAVRVAIFLDNKMVSAPVIRTTSIQRQFVMGLPMAQADAERLARRLSQRWPRRSP